MLALFIAIILTAGIFWVFKWHGNAGNNLNITVVTNYFVAATIGFIVNREHVSELNTNFSHNIWPLLILGLLFITTFILIGYSTKKSGVGLTVMASKLSIFVTILLSFLIFKDSIGSKTIIAFPIAVASIVLYQYTKGEKKQKKDLWLPLIVLLGSGVVDFFLAWLSKNSDWTTGLNASIIFLIAATLGSIQVVFTQFRIKRIDFLIGLVLGSINYASIHFFLLAFKHTSNNPLYFLLFSIGTLLISSIGSMLFFKEPINRNKIISLSLSCLALFLAY
jgi:drug/metabolite transporter (DMT)-like permease